MASDPIKRQDKDFHSGINDEMTPAGKGKETTEKDLADSTSPVIFKMNLSNRQYEERSRLIKSNSNSEESEHGYDSDDLRPHFADYEEAISAAGYGRFHYWFLLTCGWANASDAIEILCISFLLPAAECDLKLTSADKGWLTAILFLGMLIGGFIWGNLGDTYGRKIILINAMFVNAACGFLSSLSQTKATFFVFRFLSGLGVGGSIPIVWSYFAEFQPSEKRGGMLSFLAAFWMIGNITVAGIAWLVIPRELGYNTDDPDEFEYNSWRIFTLICGLPAFLVGISLFWFPESPKFLLTKGHQRKALEVFSSIYSINTGKPKSSYPITHIALAENATTTMQSENQPFSEKLKEAAQNVYDSFSGPLKKIMWLMLFINFAIQFGYYGLWLWFPELFNKLDQYNSNHTESLSVCEVTEFQSENNDDDNFCDTPIPSSEVFLNSFIISLSALPGNIWTIYHMDKLGRKFFLVLSMVLSGLCAFTIYLVSSSLANLLVSCAFGLVSTMGFNSLDCLGIELFPTHLRSTAMSVTLVAARMGAILGNLAFGYLVDSSCAIPILSVAGLLISGGLVGLLLPNTTKTPLA